MTFASSSDGYSGSSYVIGKTNWHGMRTTMAFAGWCNRVGQAWLPGGVFIPSGSPQDSTFEFWRGAGQFTAGVVEVAAGVGLVGGGAGTAGGGIAGAIPTGGASLLIAAAGGSAMTAGWAAVAHGATSVVAGLATIADSMSMMSKGSGSGTQGTTFTTEGAKLTAGGKKVLRDPSLQAMKDKTLREGILERGGGGAVVRKAGGLADNRIVDIANVAAQGDEASVKAIKLLKDAARLGGKNHGQ